MPPGTTAPLGAAGAAGAAPPGAEGAAGAGAGLGPGTKVDGLSIPVAPPGAAGDTAGVGTTGFGVSAGTPHAPQPDETAPAEMPHPPGAAHAPQVPHPSQPVAHGYEYTTRYVA